MPDIGGKSNQMSSFLKFSVILMPIAMVFDCVYSSVIRQENLYYGEKEIFRTVDKTGESWIFGIEKGHVNEFLGRYGFRQLMYADAEKLEEIYFTDENKKKSIAGERYSFHCACGETIAVGYSSGRFTPLREIVPDFAFF
jgi:O-methyltransferase involved in polyketide biosynthesis